MSCESAFSFLTAKIRIGSPGSSFKPGLRALEYRKRICSNWSAMRRAVFSPSLLATIKCGVWTSVHISGFSAGNGLLHATTAASTAITKAERAHRYRLDDIAECVSRQVGRCQVRGVSGALSLLRGVHCHGLLFIKVCREVPRPEFLHPIFVPTRVDT